MSPPRPAASRRDRLAPIPRPEAFRDREAFALSLPPCPLSVLRVGTSATAAAAVLAIRRFLLRTRERGLGDAQGRRAPPPGKSEMPGESREVAPPAAGRRPVPLLARSVRHRRRAAALVPIRGSHRHAASSSFVLVTISSSLTTWLSNSARLPRLFVRNSVGPSCRRA